MVEVSAILLVNNRRRAARQNARLMRSLNIEIVKFGATSGRIRTSSCHAFVLVSCVGCLVDRRMGKIKRKAQKRKGMSMSALISSSQLSSYRYSLCFASAWSSAVLLLYPSPLLLLFSSSSPLIILLLSSYSPLILLFFSYSSVVHLLSYYLILFFSYIYLTILHSSIGTLRQRRNIQPPLASLFLELSFSILSSSVAYLLLPSFSPPSCNRFNMRRPEAVPAFLLILRFSFSLSLLPFRAKQ